VAEPGTPPPRRPRVLASSLTCGFDNEVIPSVATRPPPPGGGPAHIALGHNLNQRPLASSAGLQQPLRELAASSQLGDLELEGCRHGCRAAATGSRCALVDPLGRALAQHGAAGRVGLGAHQRLQAPAPSPAASWCRPPPGACAAGPAGPSSMQPPPSSSDSAKNLVRMTRWSLTLWDFQAPLAPRRPRPWTLTPGAVDGTLGQPEGTASPTAFAGWKDWADLPQFTGNGE
jgi:hypothetical protein